MSFWILSNIDMWLLGGLLFCIFWIFYKAIIHDKERILERVEYLEEGQRIVFNRLNKSKSKEK